VNIDVTEIFVKKGTVPLFNEKISSLKNFPNIPNIKKLTDFEPAYRLRVGDYRVLFDVIEDMIFVGRVFGRGESYK